MLKQRGWLALAILFSSLFVASAQDKDKDKDKDKKEPPKAGDKPVLLKWKFEKDKSFYQEMTTKTEQKMKVQGSEVNQTQDQTFYFKWIPTKQEGDNWLLKQSIEGVKMNIDIGGSKISYDSTDPKAVSNPLSDFFKALVGSEFTLTLDKEMKISKIDGRAEFVDKLAKANPQMKPLLDQILSEDALKEMGDPTFAAIPNKEVKPGDKWTRKSKLSMGPIGTYENEYTYTYEGPDKDGKLQKINVETKLTYVAPSDTTQTAGLPFKIKKADLKTTEAGGTILFDPEKGRVEKTDMKVKLEGGLEIEIGGQTTKVDLTQNQTTVVNTSDSPQIKK